MTTRKTLTSFQVQLAGGLLVMLGLLLSGCSNQNLQPLAKVMSSVVADGSVDAQFCTSPPSPAIENIKYLFIIDHSASNKPGFPNPLTPDDVSNTDPEGSRRYGPMINFIQNLTPNPDSPTSFGLIDFNDTAYQPGGLAGFDADSANFIQIAQTDWIGSGTAAAPSPIDQGFTNYQAALQMALQMITQDAQNEAVLAQTPPVTTSYQIIFVSDGVPTIATPSGSSPTYTQTFTTDIDPVISSLLSLKSNPTLGPYINNITLNTAYYYNTTQLPDAEALLQQMANAGNGQYLQFASGQNILYQQFAPPSRDVRNELDDVFVENENGVWWDNGQFMLDSDGDGLPDAIEEQMGSNPNNPDSDGNGVSDLVEYRLNGQPCQDPNCLSTNRNPYSICDGFSPVTDANGNVTFSSSSNDGLNDCEKFLLGADPDTFNTNGDLIPDMLAFKNNLPIVPGSAADAFADPFGDGISNFMKIQDGMPISVSDKELLNFTSRQTNLVQVTLANSSPDVTCYHLTVNNVALSAMNNTIKVMVVQNSSAAQSEPFMVSAEKQISGALTATFLPGDFK